MFDSIIIGTGPAGLSAALNLKIYKKDFIWFGSKDLSSKVQKAEKIANYPGIPMASGQQLFEAFDSHRQAMGIEITEKTVTNVMQSEGHFMVLADNELYESKTLILCMGVLNAKLLEGEGQFLGRGLSYCATCDGMFYKGKKIAVLTNDKKYEHEVEFLADIAEEVYYFPTFRGSEVDLPNVKVMSDFPVAIEGGFKVNQLRLRSGAELPVDGFFALRNAIAPSQLVAGLEVEDGHVKVDRKCCTNLPGCFAAGDCTGRPYQYTKAVGEGNVAAHSCIEFLSERK